MKKKFKIMLSILLIFTLMSFSMTVSADELDEIYEDGFQIVEHNLQTGEKKIITIPFNNTPIESSYVQELSNSASVSDETGEVASPFKIIGEDNRWRIEAGEWAYEPFSSIGALRFKMGDSYYGGTAAMVGPDYGITAAHCFLSDGEVATDITFSPGQNGDVRPYGTTTVLENTIYYPLQWTMGSEGYDWAVFRTSTSIGLDCGWLSYDKFENVLSYPFGYVLICGYPSEYRSGVGYAEAWMHESTISHIDDYNVYYTTDTTGGQSGSPLIVWDGDDYVVVGVHAYGYDDDDLIQLNYGPKISDAFLSTINSFTTAR